MNREFNIEGINNINELISLCDKLSSEYGSIISLRVFDKKGYYKEVNDIGDIGKDISKNDIINSSKITMSIYNSKGEIYSVTIDTPEKKCTIIQIVLDESKAIVETIETLSPEREAELISDQNYDYYKFDNGTYVRYSHENNLYYKTTKNYEWVQDNSVLSWFMDSEHNYDTLKKNSSLQK